jgi:hypothetical protein
MAVADTLEAIKSLLHPHKIQLSVGASLSIREFDTKAKLKLVEVSSVGQQAFAIVYDNCKFPTAELFVHNHALHRACDAVVFCVVDSRPFIVCFELKSSRPKLRGFLLLVQATSCSRQRGVRV